MANPAESDRPSPRLLLLGDNAFKRKLAKLSLRALGARVVEAETIEQAERMLASPVEAEGGPPARIEAAIVALEATDGVAAVARLSRGSGAAFAVMLERDDRAARIAAASAGAALTLREPVDWAAALEALRPSLRAGSGARRAGDETSETSGADGAGRKAPPRAAIAPTRWRWYPDSDRVEAGVEARAAMLAPAAPVDSEQSVSADLDLDAFVASAAEPSPQVLRAAFEAALQVTGETFLVGRVADRTGVAAGFGLFAERRRDGEGRLFLTGAAHRVSVESGRQQKRPRDKETGLALRAELIEELEALVPRLRAERRRCAVFSIELPEIHELAAEAAKGDAEAIAASLLAEAARRLRETLREGDLLARDEGARFIVVQPSVLALDDARGLARRLLTALAEPFKSDAAEEGVCLSASIGGAVGPDRRRGAVELLLAARAAERRAARQGPRRYVLDSAAANAVENDGPGRAARRRSALTALERGAFELHYQPAIGRNGAVSALDVLIRLNDGEDWIDAEAVIDSLDARGDVAGLLERLFGQAVEDLALWTRAFQTTPRLAVKLSGAALIEGRAVDAAALALAEHGLPADRLRFEFDERRLQRRRAEAIQELRRAQSVGAELTLDGFGGPAATIETLAWAPVDRVKLARTLCRAPAQRRPALIEACVAMVDGVGAKATLVGVEDSATLALGFEAGCDEAQGFGVAPPASITELVSWFSAERRAAGGAE